MEEEYQPKSNTWAIALILSFIIIVSGISFALTAGGSPQHDQTTLGTWYNVPTSCANHDNCELFGNGMNISNDNWGLRQFFSVGNQTYLAANGAHLNGYLAHLNLDCIGRFGGTVPIPDYRLNFTLEYAIYGDYNGPAAGPPTYSSNITNWQALESLPVDADILGTTARQGCVYDPDPTNTNRWTETGPDKALNSTARATGGLDCTQITVADCGYVFRIILCCASSTGENVEVGSISITILQSVRRVYNSFVSSTTSTLSYNLITSIPFPQGSAVAFQWFATNVSSTGKCGVSVNIVTGIGSTFHCSETGNSSCAFVATATLCPLSGVNTITYGTAFTGTVRAEVFSNRQTSSDIYTAPISTLTVVTAQPVPNV